MTLKELREKKASLLAEIDLADEKRFAEIKTEIEKINFQICESTEEDSNERKQEELLAGREKREIAAITEFNLKRSKGNEELSKEERSKYSKSAFGKELRAMLNNSSFEFNENEKRALGVSLTTTAKEYVAATAEKNGVNNGGIFISDNVMYDLLEIETLDSPFLKDCMPTHIKGAVIFPYVEERTLPAKTARGKKEGEKADDLAIKWGKMTLAQGNYPLTIEVSMEVLALADDMFAQYILDELRNEMDLLLGDEVLYGSGTNDRIEGVTVSAIKGEYETLAEGIQTAFKSLSKRARKGAKLYISHLTSLNLAFEKDKNGQYLFPIYNQATGIKSIVQVPVEIEEGLVDDAFLYGNAKNYKLNFTKATEVYSEVHGKTRVIESTAHLMVAGKAAPNKFYYGTKKETESTTSGDSE
ncbi:MAG: phage major capsid protein [Bacilli bacterium]|nr:phage major capsid protein [Bacilli bacterium]DAV15277.1 MAG TPA: major capsid protein [Caudoviricetes sp.]